MKSEAHDRLHMIFSLVKVGDLFQLVNSVAGTVIHDAYKYEKIATETNEKGFIFNAKQIGNGTKVRIRDTAKVLVIKAAQESN